ncbi:hypothetical protein NYE40_05715 [Paenibacillus sp. FSL W8-1187]|uniref:hypothetical protein n=1 Tax=Paenibacillus TaxID=44249 RepID=UPI000FD7F9F3|nr:hypothetical protein [Paenibacillus pasadenensis]
MMAAAVLIAAGLFYAFHEREMDRKSAELAEIKNHVAAAAVSSMMSNAAFLDSFLPEASNPSSAKMKLDDRFLACFVAFSNLGQLSLQMETIDESDHEAWREIRLGFEKASKLMAGLERSEMDREIYLARINEFATVFLDGMTHMNRNTSTIPHHELNKIREAAIQFNAESFWEILSKT